MPCTFAKRGAKRRDIEDAARLWRGQAFQKKSKIGSATPRREMELIEQRLREAEEIAKGRGHD